MIEGDILKDTIQQFWFNFLEILSDKINQYLNRGKKHRGEMKIDDDSIVNFFVMILKKVLNHVFMQCEFKVISDSAIVEPLKKLCEDLQKNCYKIGGLMLGGSDTPQNISECWVVPSIEVVGGEQKLFHTYLGGDRVRITGMTADKITDCYLIVDAVKRNEKPYLLCRHHELDSNGTLKISYFISNEQAQPVTAYIPEWESIAQEEIVYEGANHIGLGRYKSPVMAFNDDIYGKPLNYGCSVIEDQIQTVIKQIQLEFKSKGTKLFPDWSIVKKTNKDGKPIGMYCIDEYIYPVKHPSGQTANLIDEFSPAIRDSSYYTHLKELIKQYEALCGLNNILIKDSSANATATEIKALNIDNIALEDNIKQAVRSGNIMTLEADSIYLGIRRDLWSYDETWTDIYDDEQKRLENNLKMYEAGASELSDLVAYWFPTLSQDEIKDKIERINAARQNGTQLSIESMLNI